MTLYWLELTQQTSIYDQLLIEEMLLSCDNRNFCIVSEGSSDAIVMGISGKIAELIDEGKAKALQIPIIRRFSGGGTVVVDKNTLFVTFIFQKTAFDFPPFPEKIMQWTEKTYAPVFSPLPFALRENDYVIGEKKFGGNAQYIKKERFLHHTSFLWDFCPQNMSALLHPKKTPSYREQRSHFDFLCTLKDFLPSKAELFRRLKTNLAQHFTLIPISQEDLPTPQNTRITIETLNN